MGRHNCNALPWLPFAPDTKGNETSAVSADKVLISTLDFVGPGFSFGEFGESGFCEDCFSG